MGVPTTCLGLFFFLNSMQVLNKYKLTPEQTGVYIGRGSLLGNPFKEGSREENIALFEGYFLNKLRDRDPGIERAFRSLHSSDKLICYCHPEPCHGDVIKACYEKVWEELDYEAGLKHLLRTKGMILDPAMDGISHINIYSKAATQLGRALSNFAHIPFEIPGEGEFASVEGYWYYLGTGCKHEKLRTLHGYEAKKFGKNLEKVPCPDFQQRIENAVRCKMEALPALKEAFKKSTLPLQHYYYYGTIDNPKVITVKDVQWLTDFLTKLRIEYQRV